MPKMAPAAPTSSTPSTPPTHANLPIHTVRHRNIKATIWRNQTDKGNMYNVTVARGYKDGDQWHDSHSFGFNDLMNLAKALYDAHSYISAIRAKDNARNRGPRGERSTP